LFHKFYTFQVVAPKGQRPMPDQPSTADIRQSLFDFFNDEELTVLCFDFFREVHDNFASGMTRAQKVQLLLDYCDRRTIIPNLLAAIQRARPEQYKERFPQAPKVQARPEPAKPIRDPKQVFVCHAHEDADFAHRLANDLRQNGWRVWIAPDSIQSGEMWGEGIDRGMDESGVLVLVLTPRSVQSPWVRKETYVAIQLESQGRIKFMPLEVEPCDVPGLWSTYQRISFQSDYGSGLNALLDVLEPARRERREREAQESARQLEAERQAKLATQKAEAERQERERNERAARLEVMPSQPHLPGWALPVAGSVLVMLFLTVIAWLVGSTIYNNAANSAATQTAVAMSSTQIAVFMSSTSTPFPVVTRIAEKDGMVMVYVPAGEFLMGAADSDSHAEKDEKPQHTVYLDAFWIDQTEVTNEQYNKCVQANMCVASSYANDDKVNGHNQPVVGVRRPNAQLYCQWAGRQLPTEAQWEKAARGTDGRIYPWGNDPATCDYAVMDEGKGKGCGKGDSAWPVRSKPKGASPYGALDMAGNVWEWVADWWSQGYYSISPSRNPQGPSSGDNAVLRGGSWDNGPANIRASYRSGYLTPDNVYYHIGFRCALVPGESTVSVSTGTPTNIPAPVTPTMTPTAAPGIGSTRVSAIDGMVMVYVPAGEFLMGSTDSDKAANANEKPQHAVYLDAFWIDSTEVTNAQYKKCVQVQKCKASTFATDFSFNGDNQPAVGVDWSDAKSYCEWAGRQLPTEAQWEKAARGTDGRIYPWGNTAPDSNRLNFFGQVGKTTEVGKYPTGASPYGALDMAGNVWEWTSSLYKPYPYKADDGREDMSSSGDRVRRGGSFRGAETDARAAFRHPGAPVSVWETDGFRCGVGVVFPISLK
jgi:formylglycine-generating enzyme required for sulfatase activity